MKAFLVLPFLLLLLGNSQESALSRKRSIRGLNTTLQTNFNGTFQLKNPCTNADLETSSYVASHEFHHHIKENNWSDYLQKCSAIINSFLRGVGNLVRFNSKQNAAFNFHVNTSISQKQDIGDCEKQCESLPTIVIEAESRELPPACKSSQKIRNEYLLKQDVRHSSKTPDNYLTTPQFPTEETLKEGFDVEEKQQKDQNLINYESKENITPISRFSTSTIQVGIGETNDLSQNEQATCKSEFFGTSGPDFTASITIKPEDEFTSSLTPAPWQDYSEGNLFANPETQDYPYSTPTISEYQTTPRPSFNDEKIINNQYQMDQKPNFGDLGEKILDKAPVHSSASDFESESVRVEKPFKYQHTVPLGLGEPDYVEEMIPPSERFQPADLQTKPYPQILDRYPLQQRTQSIDDMYINTASKQKDKVLPQGHSLAYPPRPETSYTSQINEHKYLTTPLDDCLTTPPFNLSTPENDFRPKLTSNNEFSKSKFQSITDIYTTLTEPPFIPGEKLPTELPPKTPNFPESPSSYPDVYTMGPEKPINDFHTPAVSKFRKNGKIPHPIDVIDDFSSTIPPPESVTIYDSDEDVLKDRLSSPAVDEESYIKSQSFPPSVPFSKDQNEKTVPNYSSPVPSDDYKNSDFESLKPTLMEQKSKSQLESESLTKLQQTATYPEVEVPRFSNFQSSSHPPKRTFKPTTTPSPPVTYYENDLYPSDYPSIPENPLPSTLEHVAYSEASSQSSAEVDRQGFNDFVNPNQPPKPRLEQIAYVETSSQASAKAAEAGINDFGNPDQASRAFESITTPPPPPVTYPEDNLYPSNYPSTPENSPLLTSEPIVYSKASSQAVVNVDKPGFNDFKNPDQPRRNFEPIRTSPPSVGTYPEDEFYPKSIVNGPQSTSTPLKVFEPTSYAEVSSEVSAEVDRQGFNDFVNPNQPPKPRLEQIAYAEASSRASAKAAEGDINDFENPDQTSRAFESITTPPPPPVTYAKNDFYPSDYLSSLENPPPSTLEPIAYSGASSQAFTEIKEKGFNDFETPEQSRQKFEPIRTSPPSATNFEDGFYSKSVLNEPQSTPPPPEALEPSSYSKASSQASAKIEEIDFPNFENPNQPPRSRFEPTAYSEPSSQPFSDFEAQGFINFENPDLQSRQYYEHTTTPPPVTYPKDNFYSSDYPSTLENSAPSTSEPIAYSKTSSQAFVKAEEQDLNDFEHPDQPPRPRFEPTAYSEPSSQTFAHIAEQDFNDFENHDQQPRQSFEHTATAPPPVTYPEDYPSTPENPPPSSFESQAYSRPPSQASAEVEEQDFNDFENSDERPGTFEPITTSVGTYSENNFYPSDYPSTLENPTPSTSEPPAYSKTSSQAFGKAEEQDLNDFENPDQPPRPRFEPTAYSEPSSQTFAHIAEQDFNDFENPDQQSGQSFERTTTPPPVTYPKDNFYSSDYPSTLENSTPSTSEPIAYSRASAQAFATVEEQGFNDFETPDQPPKAFETLTPPVAYSKDEIYLSTKESPPPSTFEPTAYSAASSQTSARVEESSVNDFENRDQPIRNFSPSSVTYPEDDFYRKSEENRPQSTPYVEDFGPTTYAEATSKVFADIQESRLSNFENLDQQPKQNFEPITTPPPVTNPEDDFYPSDYQRKILFDQSTTSNSEDHSRDYLPTTQSPDNLSFSSFKTQADAQSESIIRSHYNRSVPTDLPLEANLPLLTKRQSLPVNVENVAVVLSDAQSDLPLNQFASSQSQPPLDYYDERVSDRYSQKALVPLDTTSIPQPQSEEETTPPSYQDYISREEPFGGDSTPPPVKSQEKMLIYSPPFEPESQPQPQPSSYISGDKILDSKTFENSKTPSLLSNNLEFQDRSSFGTAEGYTESLDFLTTPTPLTNIPSFQTPLKSKPEKIITDSQHNISTRENLLFGNNVSPQPQPTTAVKTYKEIVTTEYQTSPAPSPQPQTAMNNANQHSDDNLSGKIPGLFTNQQQLATSEPDFDLSTSEVASESFSQSEQITENHQKMTDYPAEEAPQSPINYPHPNSFLPYNNQLRSQPIYRQPPPSQQESPTNFPQNPSENVKQDVPPVREVESEPSSSDSRILASSRMQPEDNVWMWHSNEQVPILPDDSVRPPAPHSQIPPERVFYPEQNYNAREGYFPQESRREFSRPPPNLSPSNEPRRSFNPDFQRELKTDSRTNSYNRPQSFDSFNSAGEKTKVVEGIESPTEKQFDYQEKFFNDKNSEHVTDDRRFEPSENYRPSNRQYKPRNFPQHPQQVEPFNEDFPPNTSYPDYGQIRPQNDFPVPGRDYPQYDQVFPNPPQFVQDEVIAPSMSNRQSDRRAPDVNQNQYYPERSQRPGNYLPDREPLFEKQQHSNPLFQTLEDQIKIPLQEPPLPEMPNESQRNYFRDNSPGWENPNPPPPLPESQSVPDLSVPSNNPDRAANGRFNYMDRPLRKPFYEDRMRPVSTPERF